MDRGAWGGYNPLQGVRHDLATFTFHPKQILSDPPLSWGTSEAVSAAEAADSPRGCHQALPSPRRVLSRHWT